ncbi:hypothetical protein PF004_g31745, partial [Phytophthora fragariae]
VAVQTSKKYLTCRSKMRRGVRGTGIQSKQYDRQKKV